MRITFYGAAGEVTGSSYLVETDGARVLVDFGLFQGPGEADRKNRRADPKRPRRLDAVVLTHGHLDHCGRLPLLARRGYHGLIHATAATIDVAQLVLEDAAHLQRSDIERQNRHRMRQGKPPIEPLYSPEEVEGLRPLFRSLPYGQAREVAEGITLRFSDAGHILGSASVELTGNGPDGRWVIVFSGDLGPRGVPFLRDPVPPSPSEEPDVVVLESTYGDRDHRPLDQTLDELRRILLAAIEHGEMVLIPSFAIGRAQQILYHIAEFVERGEIPQFPIYLDSPMGIKALALYRSHSELLNQEAVQMFQHDRFDRALSRLHCTRTTEESRALNDLRGMALIIAGSGMCEGGRIVHHLKHHLWRPHVQVILVGFQVQGTLGARLVGGARRVTIHGEPIKVNASIHTLGGFSAHAGQSGLIDWAGNYCKTPKSPRVILTHGEDGPRAALRDRLESRFGVRAECPAPGDILTIKSP